MVFLPLGILKSPVHKTEVSMLGEGGGGVEESHVNVCIYVCLLCVYACSTRLLAQLHVQQLQHLHSVRSQPFTLYCPTLCECPLTTAPPPPKKNNNKETQSKKACFKLKPYHSTKQNPQANIPKT